MEGSDKKVSWKEEEWCLQDVIFVEDIRHVPVGEVLKVDGAYAMVHFSSKLLNGGEGKDAALGVDAMLKESVIRRKDELQVNIIEYRIISYEVNVSFGVALSKG